MKTILATMFLGLLATSLLAVGCAHKPEQKTEQLSQPDMTPVHHPPPAQ